MLTDASGFPLTVQAFEGNKAETATMLPVINAFKVAHQLSDVTVIADAGMISEANQVALHAAGLSYILGARIPFLPDVVREWHAKHPDEQIPDGLVLTQPWPSTSAEKTRGIPDRLIHYQYRHDRARKTLRGIDQQVAKAQRAVDGHAPVKRNRYIQLTGATKSVNRTLEAKTRALAGWKGYTTNLTTEPADFVWCSPRWPYPTGSSTKPVGASRNSSAPPADTAPCKSAPDDRSSPPPTPYPTTSLKPSPRSTATMCTNLAQVR